MAITKIAIKKGEGKTIKFTYKEGGVVKDMTGATFSFVVKTSKAAESYTIEKTDGDFDKTDIATGIVKVILASTDTAISAGSYTAEIKATFSVSSLDISQDIPFLVDSAVHD